MADVQRARERAREMEEEVFFFKFFFCLFPSFIIHFFHTSLTPPSQVGEWLSLRKLWIPYPIWKKFSQKFAEILTKFTPCGELVSNILLRERGGGGEGEGGFVVQKRGREVYFSLVREMRGYVGQKRGERGGKGKGKGKRKGGGGEEGWEGELGEVMGGGGGGREEEFFPPGRPCIFDLFWEDFEGKEEEREGERRGRGRGRGRGRRRGRRGEEVDEELVCRIGGERCEEGVHTWLWRAHKHLICRSWLERGQCDDEVSYIL